MRESIQWCGRGCCGAAVLLLVGLVLLLIGLIGFPAYGIAKDGVMSYPGENGTIRHTPWTPLPAGPKTETALLLVLLPVPFALLLNEHFILPLAALDDGGGNDKATIERRRRQRLVLLAVGTAAAALVPQLRCLSSCDSRDPYADGYSLFNFGSSCTCVEPPLIAWGALVVAALIWRCYSWRRRQARVTAVAPIDGGEEEEEEAPPRFALPRRVRWLMALFGAQAGFGLFVVVGTTAALLLQEMLKDNFGDAAQSAERGGFTSALLTLGALCICANAAANLHFALGINSSWSRIVDGQGGAPGLQDRVLRKATERALAVRARLDAGGGCQ